MINSQAMNPQVDAYLIDGCGRCKLYATPDCKVHFWQRELHFLRSLLQNCGLTEELKWDVPCYTYQGKNVIILAALKGSCTLSFLKGALLKDTHQLLQKPGEATQEGRVIRFTSLEQIEKNIDAIIDYVEQAMQNEAAGLKVVKNNDDVLIPDELKQALKDDKQLKSAFDKLTPGRKRAYYLHIGSAKQSSTRVSRIQKCYDGILRGKGPLEY